ncbi:condensin-2 complex subunit G2 isoform X3 [Narcine bancroftii]|uniref:condensin-2 complex subunit G2 isoform X3 n=1 Tax=Narcine bancroftii TaxID=1343680 RepID=UPI0038317A9C
MSKRESFLQSVCKNSVKEFLNFILLHKNKSDPFDLNELLQEFPRKQKVLLWKQLKTLLTDVLLDNPVENWQKYDEDSDDEMEVEGALDLKETLSVISGITEVVAASVPVIDEDVVYSDLLEIAIIFNGIMPVLPTSETVLKISIQHLFEAWWEKGLEGKEELGKTAFIMLLEKSLMGKFSNADIVRLWQFHQALENFEFNSEASNEVKDILLQCFMRIAHIKKEEGRRFLSFLFSWDVEFIKMIHGTIKNQLHFFPKPIIPLVAEIYFRAWKKASGLFLETIEYSCIQDFMHHGVHLPRSSPVHSKVREFLSYFHQQKLRQGVDEMLQRLYQPILWRGLKARNSEVRANAAVLFVEAFPIRDPTLTNEDIDIAIQKQFDEIFNLLEDPQPLVRSTGVLGACRIAAKYWEMIRPSILTDLLTKVLHDLSADTSSADVRCSVFKCLLITLDNKMSHPLLEQLLPGQRNSLHDASEKVRVAFVDMLLKVKATRAAKFWKICPMEHLLARLEVDSRPVAKRIVNLLFNSFFPVNQPEDVWCERCVTLVQMNPMAARRFYQYSHVHTAPTNIAKLMLVIRRCLNACIQRAAHNENETNDDDHEQQKENISKKMFQERKVRIQETVPPKLELAINFLEYILTNIMSRECLLDLPPKKLHQLLKVLAAIKDLLVSFLNSSEVMLHDISVDTAFRAFSLHCRLCIHLHNKICAKDRNYLLILEDHARWIDEQVLQFMYVPGKEIEVSEHQVQVAKQLVDTYLSVCKDIVMVGASDTEFQAHLLGFAVAVMNSEKGIFSLPVVISILKEVTVNCLSQDINSTNEKTKKILGIIQKVFHKILEILARSSKKNQEEAQQVLTSIQLVLGEFICSVANWHGVHEVVYQEILSTLLAAMLAETIHAIKKKSDAGDITPPETAVELPVLSSYLLSIVLKYPGVIRSFLNELVECINSEAIQGFVGLVAALHFLLVLSRGKVNVKRAVIKDTAIAIHRKFQLYSGIISESGDIERALYSSSNKHLDELLHL